MDETAERLEKRIDRVDDRTHADYRQLVKDVSELKTAVRVLGVKLDERSAPRRSVLQKAAGDYTRGDRPESSPEPR